MINRKHILKFIAFIMLFSCTNTVKRSYKPNAKKNMNRSGLEFPNRTRNVNLNKSDVKIEKTGSRSDLIKRKTDAYLKKAKTVSKAAVDTKIEKQPEKVISKPQKDSTMTESKKVQLLSNNDFYYPFIHDVKVKDEENLGNAIKFILFEKSEIKACSGGVVMFVGKEEGLPGTTVIVMHNGDYTAVYANLSSVDVVKGQIIIDANVILGTANDFLYLSIKKRIEGKIKDFNFKKILKKRINYS